LTGHVFGTAARFANWRAGNDNTAGIRVKSGSGQVDGP
jgi:hypothetical protein